MRRFVNVMSAMMAFCVLSMPTIGGDIPDMIRSSFTYQGSLEFEGVPANGDYYFRFSLFDTNNTWLDSQYSTVGPVTVADGLFTAEIMMGDDPIIAAQFWRNSGMAALTMLIEVGEVEGVYTALSPRVAITAAPQSVYSIRSMSSNVADMLRFPYVDSYHDLVTMVSLTSNSGSTVIEAIAGVNIYSPILSIESATPNGLDYGWQTGGVHIDAEGRLIGLVSIANQYPIAGIIMTDSGSQSAALLGQVNIGVVGANALHAMNRDSQNDAYLGTPNYAGDFSGDVLARNNLRVQGEPTRDYAPGNPSPIGPLAYGSVSSNGSVSSGTANLSAVWDSVNSRYVVSVAGESMAFATHSVSIAVVDSNEPRIGTFVANFGDLWVYIWDLNSGYVKVQDNFSIMIYDANPVVLNRFAVPDGVDLDQYSEKTGATLIQTRPRYEPVEPVENYGNGISGD